MQCPRCSAENREGSNFCRYCATPLAEQEFDPNAGYTPSVPPPNPTMFGTPYPPQTYQPPPLPPALPLVGHLRCPRCGSINVVKGGIPLWAILVTIIGFFIVCFFSLFFLLIKEPSRCMNCGCEFK